MIFAFFPESRGFAVKTTILRWCGAELGLNVRIYSSVRFLGTGRLYIGDDVHIGANGYISPVNGAVIRIGSHVDIGPSVMILTGSHKITPDGEHIGGDGISQSVCIGDGCWIGARAIILPGVKLPPKTVVAAGAVVTASPKNESMLIAGVPAKEKKCYA